MTMKMVMMVIVTMKMVMMVIMILMIVSMIMTRMMIHVYIFKYYKLVIIITGSLISGRCLTVIYYTLYPSVLKGLFKIFSLLSNVFYVYFVLN